MQKKGVSTTLGCLVSSYYSLRETLKKFATVSKETDEVTRNIGNLKTCRWLKEQPRRFRQDLGVTDRTTVARGCMRLNKVILSFLLVCALAIPAVSLAQTYEVRLGKKKVLCGIVSDKPLVMVRVGKKMISMKQRIKELTRAHKKATNVARKAKLSRSLVTMKANIKKSQRACVSGRPTPTPVPTPHDNPGYLSLEPYQGPVTRETVRLLTERAGYGLSSKEEGVVSIALTQGLDPAVREFMRIKEEPAGLAARVRDRFDNVLGNGGAGGNQVADNRLTITNGYARAELDFAIHSENPFRSNLQHFFFGLWTLGAEVFSNANAQAPQTPLWWDYWTNVLYASALNPKIPEQILNMSRHPAMLIYLNNADNIKGNVNENFARELMELFSMGTHRIDRETNQTTENYIEFRDGDRTQGDIYRAARCLTGWRVSALVDGQGVLRWRSIYSAADHEECAATMFEGQPWQYTMTDDASLIQGIFDKHPAPRDFLAHELLRWFLTPNPPIELVRSLGDRIHASGYDLNEPLRVLLTSKAFYDPAYINTLPKTPHQVAVEFVRTNELFRTDGVASNAEGGVNIASLTGDLASAGNLYRMNYQTPLPTDVFFFRSSEWVSSSAQLEAANLFFNVLADSTTQGRAQWLPAKVLTTNEITADQVITNIAQKFGCGENLTPDMRRQLAYYLNNRLNGSTYTRTLYDNILASHRLDKGRYLAAFFAMQPCFRLK